MVGMYGVSASNGPIRDSDLIIPLLRESFVQTRLSHLIELSTVAWVQLAKEGWLPAREDQLTVTLKDLRTLTQRDARRKGMIRAIYPKLKQEIVGVRIGTVSIETIKQRFSLLRDVDDTLLQKWVFTNPNKISESTAAIEIIWAFDSNSSRETIVRYTRHVTDAGDMTAQANWDSQHHPGRHLVRLLPPEALSDYEKLRIA